MQMMQSARANFCTRISKCILSRS